MPGGIQVTQQFTALHANEQGTRWLFGKPYHWWVEDGRLSLIPGKCASDQAADDIAQHDREMAEEALAVHAWAEA